MRIVCRVWGTLPCAVMVALGLFVPSSYSTDPFIQGMAPPVMASSPHDGGGEAWAGSDEPAKGPAGLLPQLGTAIQGRMAAAYGQLPLAFEANQGQTHGQVQFLARSQGLSLFLTPTEAVLVLTPSRLAGSTPEATARGHRRGQARAP